MSACTFLIRTALQDTEDTSVIFADMANTMFELQVTVESLVIADETVCIL